jgi:hypothetical protein
MRWPKRLANLILSCMVGVLLSSCTPKPEDYANNQRKLRVLAVPSGNPQPQPGADGSPTTSTDQVDLDNPAGTTAQASESGPPLVIEAGGHQAIIRKLLFTADGKELVSVSDDKTIRVWCVSPDGRHATLARTFCGQMEEGRGGMLAAACPVAS